MDPTDLSSVYFYPGSVLQQQQRHQRQNPVMAPSALEEHPSAASPSPPSAFFYVGPIEIRPCPAATTGGRRGLFATRTVAAGELLFVEPALLDANVEEVYELWRRRTKDGTGDGPSSSSRSLEEAAEALLLRNMVAAAAAATAAESSKDDRGKRNAMAALEGTGVPDAPVSIQQLLGCCDDCNSTSTATIGSSTDRWDRRLDDETELLQILRRNAFGPDFVTYEHIVRQHRHQHPASGRTDRPKRLLGLYPLASMLNHSCVPNAVRVFVGAGCGTGGATCGEDGSSDGSSSNRMFMIAHASQTVHEGEELLWSYIPVIQPHPERKRALLHTHGFECGCIRCRAECGVWERLEDVLDSFDSAASDDSKDKCFVEKCEELLQVGPPASTATGMPPPPLLANEVKRYVRVGFLHRYMEYLNANVGHKPPQELLPLCSQLHFSLASCFNASTEHLSVRMLFTLLRFLGIDVVWCVCSVLLV
jgi:SET domain